MYSYCQLFIFHSIRVSNSSVRRVWMAKRNWTNKTKVVFRWPRWKMKIQITHRNGSFNNWGENLTQTILFLQLSFFSRTSEMYSHKMEIPSFPFDSRIRCKWLNTKQNKKWNSDCVFPWTVSTKRLRLSLCLHWYAGPLAYTTSEIWNLRFDSLLFAAIDRRLFNFEIKKNVTAKTKISIPTLMFTWLSQSKCCDLLTRTPNSILVAESVPSRRIIALNSATCFVYFVSMFDRRQTDARIRSKGVNQRGWRKFTTNTVNSSHNANAYHNHSIRWKYTIITTN